MILIGLVSVLALSCNKKESCELNNTGVMYVNNPKLDPYYVYIDGAYVGEAIQGKKTPFDVGAGNHEFQALNENDNTDLLSTDVIITQCNEFTVYL